MVCNEQKTCEDSFVLLVKQALDDAVFENSVMLSESSRILVAFSGGPDSTALLVALVEIAKERALQLHASHINHGLRGEESDADEKFCRELCQKWGVPIYVERIENSGKSEADLREARYKAIEKVASSVKAGLCLTGHTLDDQVETMLFRLFRGTGPSGLLGIPVYRRVSDCLSLVRPLLSLSRQDCVNFLRRYDITARSDSSNRDDNYSRNFIRNKILPLAESRFSGLKEHFEQLRRVIEADDALLNCLSRDALLGLIETSGNYNIWHLDEFSELPLSLRRRVLYESFRKRKVQCEFPRIESLLEMIDLDGDGAITLNEEWEIRLTQGRLYWNRKVDKRAECIEDLAIPVKTAGMTIIHRLGLAVRVEEINGNLSSMTLPGPQEHELIVDLSRVGPLTIRLRKAGDQIQPLGMSCMVRLKKYLHTHKSTRTLTLGGRVLVLASDTEVLWVPGCGMSQRIAVSERPTHRISLLPIKPDDCGIC